MVNHGKGGRSQGRWLLGIQSALVLAILSLSLVFPTQGSAAVLVPLGHAREGVAGRWALGHGARLLQRGAPRGSVVVLVPSPRLAFEALTDGLILLPARSVGCGDETKNRGA